MSLPVMRLTVTNAAGNSSSHGAAGINSTITVTTTTISSSSSSSTTTATSTATTNPNSSFVSQTPSSSPFPASQSTTQPHSPASIPSLFPTSSPLTDSAISLTRDPNPTTATKRLNLIARALSTTSTAAAAAGSAGSATTVSRFSQMTQRVIRSTNGKMVKERKHKVSVIGSGNWGSAISKIVAENTATYPDLFQPEVKMWVFEEQYALPKDHPDYSEEKHGKGPRRLSELINELHENPKYLTNVKLPETVIATPDIVDAAKDATILVFNVPHQFVSKICDQIKGHHLPYAKGISCIKGIDVSPDGISLCSDLIGRKLGIYCGSLSGANIANEVAAEKFSETTIGYNPPNPLPEEQQIPKELPPVDHACLKSLFHRHYFHVRVISDVAGVSLGGALKNVIALAAGFVDGMGWGNNAKAAIMRVGLLEMRKFGKMYFAGTCRTATFTEESCGVADLITSCNGGRNHKCAMLSVQRNQPIEQIEEEVLNGQKLQGTSTAREVHAFLKARGKEDEFPLFTAVYKILRGEYAVHDIPLLIENTENMRTE